MDILSNPASTLAYTLLPYACRRLDLARIGSLQDNPVQPQHGDLALAEVLTPGSNQQLVLANGQSRRLARGDVLIVTLGSPYAPLAHTGRLPKELGECDLLTSSGVAGLEVARASRLQAPTRIRLNGLLGDETGKTLNLTDFALPASTALRLASNRAVPNFLVVSTARRAATSATLLQLVQDIAAHQSVATVKLNGETDGDYTARLREAGAITAFDVTDAGFASTAGAPSGSLQAAADSLIAHAEASGAHCILTRLAGGMAQFEVRELLASPEFLSRFDGVLLTAADALSAREGVRTFEALGLPVLAVSGAICQSPLATREAAYMSCPVLPPEALAEVLLQRRAVAPAALAPVRAA